MSPPVTLFAAAFGGAAAILLAPVPSRSWWRAVAGAVVATVLGLAFGAAPALPLLLLAAVVAVLLAEIDMRTLRLPDRLVLLLAGLLAPLVLASGSVLRALAAAVLVGLGHLVVALLPGDGLGLGDVKLSAVLAFGLGAIGWPAVALGVALPYLVSGPVAVYLLLSRRPVGGR
jgi:leader peptidase (prepilin peptidase) / N-methyltransferase